MLKDPQEIWDDYYAEIRARRAGEAQEIWRQMISSGVVPETILALDFLHFTSEPRNADAIADQLRENYEVTINPSATPNFWNIEGTTRPSGITLTEQEHADWVSFMCDVAQSHGCVFSTWKLVDSISSQAWSNIDT